MNERSRNRNEKKLLTRVGLALGVAVVTLTGCSADVQPTPTVTTEQTGGAIPDNTAEAGGGQPSVDGYTVADCDTKFSGQDAEDCRTAFDAAEDARDGYTALAEQTLNRVDDEGSYTRADAQKVVDAALADK